MDGTYFRVRTKKAKDLADALALLKPTAPAPKPAPAPVAPRAVAPAPRPDSPPPAMPSIEDHLRSLDRKNGWDIALDHTLISLSCDGWDTPMIATEMGLSGREVTDRFNLLTGLDRDTKTRAWKRDALLAALTGLLDAAQPAVQAAE